MTSVAGIFLCLGIMIVNSFAQTYSDIDKMLDERNFSAAESILKSKLSASAGDDSALFFLGQIPIRSRDNARFDEAIDHLSRAVSLKPNASAYHLWLARAYGLKALDGGILKAMGYAGDIKREFVKAAELDPKSFQAQYDLVQFYLQAPGIAGGSVAKAKDVADRFEKIDPELAKLLWVPIHLYEEEYDEAAAIILTVNKPNEKIALRNYRFALSNVGARLLDQEQPAKAQTIYQKMISVFPQVAGGYHGLGRSLQDQQKIPEAIALYEKAISIEKNVGSQYRLGLIYEAKGEKQKAIRYYEEFLAVRQGRKDKSADDARDRLEELKK